MRAIVTARPGADDEVELVDLPDPRPAAGQIRIRMAGAAVNAADLHIIDGSRENAAPRLGLGLDVAGVVDMAGPGVRDLAVGMPVAALTFPHASHAVAGTAAEYVIVPAADAAPVPYGVELLDAATVPLNSLTAAQLLALLGPSRGRRLLVTGAAGGVFPGLEPASERGTTVTSAVVVPNGTLLREMLALTGQGVLEPRRAGTAPLDKAAYAYLAFRTGGHRGRWVLTG